MQYADQVEIQQAIALEMEEALKPFRFQCIGAATANEIVRVPVKRLRGRSIPEGFLDDCIATWETTEGRSFGKVYDYSSEHHSLTLGAVQGVSPTESGYINVYPADFLSDLFDLWSHTTRARLALEELSELKLKSRNPSLYTRPDVDRFSGLRTAQRRAFDLVGLKAGFLWGPPGTGKTHTVGALLAERIIADPTFRVLLVASTNTAVDQAIVSVDRAIRHEVGESAAATYRGMYSRMGVWFNAAKLAQCPYVIPYENADLIEEIRFHEAQRPPRENISDLLRWKARDSTLRSKIDRIYKRIPLLAMTAHEATKAFAQLEALGKFDLVIFDEASQLGTCRALPLMTLANSAVFAGDPKQLSPIALAAESSVVRKWLGTSMFAFQDEGTTCLLDEQERMAESICEIVSKTFYSGQLRVATDKVTDSAWQSNRKPLRVKTRTQPSNVFIDVISEGATFSKNYSGIIRYRSAERIKFWVDTLLFAGVDPAEIAVVTPRHSQNQFLRATFLRDHRKIRVTTAHAVQGEQFAVVIFDPICGQKVLPHSDESDRIINVAISRAQARLIVLISAEDIEYNETLRQIRNIDLGDVHPSAQIMDIRIAAQSKLFPGEMIGQKVRLPGPNDASSVWIIARSQDDPRYVNVEDPVTLEIKRLSIAFLTR